ncbi:MAG: hypothetical protein QM770_17395 [Tepidisphaeraceae bacterium]
MNGVTLSTPITTTYHYNLDGTLDTVSEDAGTTAVATDDLVHQYGYNAFGQLTDVIAGKADGHKLFTQAFTLEADGQRDFVIEERYDGTSATPFSMTKIDWTYDAWNRLTAEQRDEGNDAVQNGNDYTDTYYLDNASNRWKKTHDAVGTANDSTTLSTYNDRNELHFSGNDDNLNDSLDSSEIDDAYSYDADGNTTSKGGASPESYTWDLRNRMTLATVNGASTSYIYSSADHRVSQVVGTSTTTYLYDNANATGYSKAIEERVSGVAQTSYIIGLSVEAQSSIADGVLTLVHDGQGRTRHVLDSTGVMVGTYDYDAYGNGLGFDVRSAKTTWLMPDGKTDRVTGDTNHLIRDLDHVTGTWRREDPTVFGGGSIVDANLLVYGSHNPIYVTDPSGTTGTFSLTELNLTVALGAALMAGLIFTAANTLIKAGGLQALGRGLEAAAYVVQAGVDAVGEGLVQTYDLLARYKDQAADALKKAWQEAETYARKAIDEIKKLPIHFVFESATPKIYAFTVASLAARPDWVLLNYNGPGNPLTAQNRAWVNTKYAALRTAPRPIGCNSLDEFPYASTTKGGRFGPAVARMVPIAEQWIQGGTLSWATRNADRLPGKPFLVVPVPL